MAKNHDDRSIMPELAAIKSGATAEREMSLFFKKAIDERTLNVLPAQLDSLVELLDRIAELHGQAYNWQPDFISGELIRHMGAQPVRTYIRAALESLDLQFLYGQKQIPDTVALTEIALGNDSDLADDDISADAALDED